MIEYFLSSSTDHHTNRDPEKYSVLELKELQDTDSAWKVLKASQSQEERQLTRKLEEFEASGI